MNHDLALQFKNEIQPLLAGSAKDTLADAEAIADAILQGTRVNILRPEAGGSDVLKILNKTTSALQWWGHVNPEGFYDSL